LPSSSLPPPPRVAASLLQSRCTTADLSDSMNIRVMQKMHSTDIFTDVPNVRYVRNGHNGHNGHNGQALIVSVRCCKKAVKKTELTQTIDRVNSHDESS